MFIFGEFALKFFSLFWDDTTHYTLTQTTHAHRNFENIVFMRREQPGYYLKEALLRRTCLRPVSLDVSAPPWTSQNDVVFDRPLLHCLSCHWRYYGAQRTLSLLIVSRGVNTCIGRGAEMNTIPRGTLFSLSPFYGSFRMVPSGRSELFPEAASQRSSCSECQEDPVLRSGASRTLRRTASFVCSVAPVRPEMKIIIY